MLVLINNDGNDTALMIVWNITYYENVVTTGLHRLCTIGGKLGN